MKYFDIKHRNAPLQIACLAVFFLGLVMYLIIPSLYASKNIWHGYYSALVDDIVPPEQLYDLLESGRFDYIAPNNSPVYVSAFDSVDEIMLSHVPERLEAMDPRFDPYIRNLSNYFAAAYQGRTWHLIYIEVRTPIVFASVQLKKMLARSGLARNVGFILLDRNPYANLFGFLLFFAYSAILAFLCGSYRRVTAAAFFPLLLQAITGGYYGFASASFLITGFFVAEKEWNAIFRQYLNYRNWNLESSRLVESALIMLASILASLLLLVPNQSPVPTLISLSVSLCCMASVFILQVTYDIFRYENQEHKLFFPLRLLRRNMPAKRRSPLFIHPVIIVLLLVFPMVLFFGPSKKNEGIPKPVQYADVDSYSWQDLERLHFHTLAGDLPNLSDFLAHRAYQDALLVSRSYDFPVRDKRIQIDEFTQTDGKIKKKVRDYLVFDDEWFVDVLSEAKTSGIMKMLMAQSVPSGASLNPDERIRVNPGAVLRHVFICIFIFSPALYGVGSLTAQSIYGMRNLLLRKKSHAT